MAEKTATLLVKLKDMASAGVSKLKSAMGGLKTAVAGMGVAFTALGGFLAKSYTAWGTQREAVLKLDTALKNVEGTTPGASQRLQELAAQLQKTTTYGDESTIAMQSMLASFGMNEQAIAKLTPRILDMATATGTDLNAAALAVGKAISTQSVGALSRYGLALDETAFKSDAVGAVTEQLTKQFGGQAEAVATGPTGALKQLQNTFGDLMETVGQVIEGPMRKFIDKLKEIIESLQQNEEAIKKVADVFFFLGEMIFNTFELAGNVIATFTFALYELVSALNDLVHGDIAGAWETLKEGSSLTFESLKEDWNKFIDKSVEATDALQNSGNKMAEIDKNTKNKLLANQKAYDAKELAQKKAKTALDVKAEQEKEAKEAEQGRIRNERLFKQQQDRNRGQIEKERQSNMAKISEMQGFFSTISTLQQSQNKALFAIGKAAAIANAIVSTAQGATKALEWGFPMGPIFSAMIIAAGMAQIHTIGATSMAEGGIVMPTEGGTLARIAEAGKPEAVIPLDEAEETMGGNVIVNINAGTLVADEEGIGQLANMLDEKFYDMKRNKESVAF